MSFVHICAIYTCFLSQTHFPAYPWDIFLHYTLGTIISLPNGIPHNDTKPYPWEISLLHICATYTCFSSVAHFLAYPWDTLYPRDNHIPAKWNTSVFHLLKFKKMLATPVDCASQGLNFMGRPVMCYFNRSFFFLTGKIAAGNLNLYLPFLLKEIQANPKRQYLLLHSLKEVCTS